MTWVKVCGLTEEDDVAAVVNAGADAIGFVNVADSPRYVTLQRVAELARGIAIHTVLLTLDVPPDSVLQVLEDAGVSGIQPYGAHAAETAGRALDAGHLVLSPQRAVAGLQLGGIPGIPLIDTPSDSKLGGTGQAFDWSLATGVHGRFVLAGGLGPHNVADAIDVVHPWGVDASSALEQSPGRKDHGMVTDFITKAKNT